MKYDNYCNSYFNLFLADVDVCVLSNMLAVTVLIAPVEDGDLDVYVVQLASTDFVIPILVRWFRLAFG